MRKYTEEFKESIVNLYNSGKPSGEIIKEYGMSSSVFYKWVRKYSRVQISETESISMKEVNEMKKRLAELEEENMILKKTVTIFVKE